MSSKNIFEVTTHVNETISKLDNYLKDLLLQSDIEISKADKLAYWINDWTKYLQREDSFVPSSLRRYKRGEIIKVNLGFNIGSEEGGLHYAVVIDKNNSIQDPTIRIIPLTSVKDATVLSNLHPSCIFLGNELFTNLSSKVNASKRIILTHLNEVQKLKQDSNTDIQELFHKIDSLERELHLLTNMNKEISKMKKGSIALVAQITTISKMRIYDPKTNHDVLSGIKLSNEKLDLLDKAIIDMYTK